MLDALPSIPLFYDLTQEQSSLLKTIFEIFTCPPDTTIFAQGDLALKLYIILKGKVAISYKPYDTPAIILTRLGIGDVFGWSAVIGSSKYTSSVISESAVEAICIHRENLWRLVSNNPELGKIIIDRLALSVSPRWKNAHEQITSFLKLDR